jgi:hypothetical protein
VFIDELVACLLLLMQLPRKLGMLASSLVADNPFRTGVLLPSAVANIMEELVDTLRAAGVRNGGQLKEFWPPVQQQLVDSGMFTCLQQLMEATAQQLERCTAAAAAAPADDSGAGFAAAAAVAAAMAAASEFSPSTAANAKYMAAAPFCLAALQDLVGRLMQFVSGMYSMHSSIQQALSIGKYRLASCCVTSDARKHAAQQCHVTTSSSSSSAAATTAAAAAATAEAAAEAVPQPLTRLSPPCIQDGSEHSDNCQRNIWCIP